MTTDAEEDTPPEVEYPLTRPPGRPPLALDLIEKVIRDSAGITHAIAEKLGVAPSTVSNWFARYPQLRAIREEASEKVVDLAETGLIHHVKEKNLSAIIFTLKTKGKRRGYSERHEITGPGGGPIITASYSDLTDIPIDERLAALDALKSGLSEDTGGDG